MVASSFTSNHSMTMTSFAGRKLFATVLFAGAGITSSAQAVVPTAAAATQPVVAAARPVTAPLVTGLPDFTDLIDKVGPAVVNIRTTEKVKTAQGEGADDDTQELLRRFFGIPAPRQPGQQAPRGRRTPRQQAPQDEDEVQRGVGSGFIISADGYVLTNAHVVDGADEVIVTLTDRRELTAKVLGSDQRSDVALLKVEAVKLPYLTIGDSSKIRVGEWVIAIGSPFNLENTVTAGIISAKSRDTGEYLPLIQSDVAVNPGNSGGPMINMRGEVIGINSQIATLSGGYNGISFAVPIDEAMRVSDQLKKTGRVTRGRMGVKIGEVSKEVAQSLGLDRARGVEVTLVEAGGPAEKAGVRVGDIILKFNGAEINHVGDLPRMVGAADIGSRATITLWRQGAQRDLAVGIAALDDDKPAKKLPVKKPAPEQVANALGLHVSTLTEAQRAELKIDGGVVVDAAEGAAARTGIAAGDVLLQINNIAIKDAAQFNALVAKLDPAKPVALLVKRDDATQYVVIKARK
jgi:serine protease Do